mmetsp:Transcript_24431/g.61411  ORF Transcript_24431/g.61411 Transcript_24431/m.61411 type:complete len:204 (+) Transcript_24431:1155-1766(+)
MVRALPAARGQSLPDERQTDLGVLDQLLAQVFFESHQPKGFHQPAHLRVVLVGAEEALGHGRGDRNLGERVLVQPAPVAHQQLQPAVVGDHLRHHYAQRAPAPLQFRQLHGHQRGDAGENLVGELAVHVAEVEPVDFALVVREVRRPRVLHGREHERDALVRVRDPFFPHGTGRRLLRELHAAAEHRVPGAQNGERLRDLAGV